MADTLPGDTLPGDTLPGDTLPGDTLPGDTLPSDTLPGDTEGDFLPVGRDADAAPTRPGLQWRRLFGSAVPTDPEWRRLAKRAGIAYLISRLCVMAGAAIVAAQSVVADRADDIARPANAIRKITDVLTSWDGKWYFALIRDSYPSRIPPNVTWDEYQARTAFFPVYPSLVRAFDTVLPGGDVFAGIVLNFILGAIAIYIVGRLARELFDDQVAYRAMLLMALFPGSFVLSFTYSEAMLLVVAAGCLLCLHRSQWVAAGVLASIGAATRPNGIALIAACGIAALLAVKQRREWRSLSAVALAPVGFVGFHLFLYFRTREDLAWFRTQGEAWDEGTSFGFTAIRNTVEAFIRPLSSPTDIITAVSFLATLFLIYTAWKKRLPWPVVTYCVVVLVLMLAPSTVTARPRFLYTAFPLLISAAAWIRDIEIKHQGDHRSSAHELWTVVLGLGAAGLVALTGLYGVYGAIP